MTNSDLIAGASACVAVCALALSIWQAIEARKHARLSATPIFECESISHGRAGIFIRNVGLGPAYLTSITARHEAATYNLSLRQDVIAFISAMVPDDKHRRQTTSVRPTGKSAVAVGGELRLVGLEAEGDQNLSTALARFYEGMTLTLVYEDIYQVSHTKSYPFNDPSDVPLA